MAYSYTFARSVKVYSPIRFANWASADSGTRTHTLAHKNLNLACLPIPSYLRTFTIIPSAPYPVKPFRSSSLNRVSLFSLPRSMHPPSLLSVPFCPGLGALPPQIPVPFHPVLASALPSGAPGSSPEQLRRRCDGSRKMLSPPGGEKTAGCCFQLTPRHGCRVSATPHPAPARIHFSQNHPSTEQFRRGPGRPGGERRPREPGPEGVAVGGPRQKERGAWNWVERGQT